MRKLFFSFLLALLVPMAAGAQEPYAVLSDNNTVLTFYYDEYKKEHNGMDVGPFTYNDSYSGKISSGWDEQRESIKSVVFDASFANCTTLTSTAYWFYGFKNLTSFTGISNLKTDNVTDMSHMFSDCLNLTSLDVSQFDTNNVTNMSHMFSDCLNLTSLDVSHFNTNNVTNMSGMFQRCRGLTVIDLSHFDTSNVTDMSHMFDDCRNLTSLDMSHFDTSNVTNMCCMFVCPGLTNLDLSNFDTSKVTNMTEMFAYCYKLISLDLSNFDTSNVTNMDGMFLWCYELTSLDMSHFDTSNVTRMTSMFNGCRALRILDMSHFDTSNLIEMKNLVWDTNIEQLILGHNFNTGNVRIGNFRGCTLSTLSFIDDIPTSMKQDLFLGLGTKEQPVKLDVSDAYLANYQSHFENGKFYGGYFTLVGASQPNPEPSSDQESWIVQFGGKKLLSITEESSGSKRHFTFEYDEQGRISKYTKDVNGGNNIINYTYIGDDQIYMDDGIEPITYKLTNGKLTWATIFYDSYANCNISYNGDKMSRIDSEGGYYGEYVWDSDNPSEWIVKTSRGSTVFQAKYTFNNTSTHPLMHALFGLGEYFPSDFDEKLAVYPYLGELPKGLIERETHSYDGGALTREYSGPYINSYAYELNSEGDVVKVTKTNEVTYKTTVYTLEWEGGSTVDEDIATTNKGNADFGEGGNINEQTDLNGNVINNVYYNISSNNGGYDSTEGCIVVNTPTKEDDIDGKDIFGEDFKNHFTGIVFKVAAGSGSIKVKAETVGGMLLKVRIGNNEPFEMMMKGSIAATFPYNVDKPTYVYIYAGSLSDMSRTRGSSDSALKIYGIEWESDVINGDANGDGVVDSKDIIDIVNHTMGKPTSTGKFDENAADMNGDGVVNVADIVQIISSLYE